MSLEDDLKSAILEINKTYDKLSNEYTGETFNFRKEKVKDTIGSDLVIKSSYQISFDNYRKLLIKNQLELIALNFELDNNPINSDGEIIKVSQRIKSPNSIYEKIRRYCNKKEHGNTPLIKCLNDFFGIRLTFTNLTENEDSILNELDLLQKEKIIRKYYLRNDGEYTAIHITLNGNDNLRYPWELQLWDQSNFERNMLSHDEHKKMTEYTNIPNRYFSKMN